MNYIDQLKDSTNTFQDLKKMLGPKNTEHIRFLLYDDLAAFKSLDELMELGAVIVLLEIESKRAPKVGHFILLLNQGNRIEHFDSYGLTMDEELAFTHERHLTNLFKGEKFKKIINNTKRLQMFREDINTCGRWCVARYLLRRFPLDMFIDIFNHLRPQTADEMVTVMTMLLKNNH